MVVELTKGLVKSLIIFPESLGRVDIERSSVVLGESLEIHSLAVKSALMIFELVHGKGSEIVPGRNSAETVRANRSKARKYSESVSLLDPERTSATAKKVFGDGLSLDVLKLGLESRGQPDVCEKAGGSIRLGRQNRNGNDLSAKCDVIYPVRRKGDLVPDVQLGEVTTDPLDNAVSIIHRVRGSLQMGTGKSKATEFRLKNKPVPT